MKLIVISSAVVGIATAATSPVVIQEPTDDRWMYPANFTPGTRAQAGTFSALPDDGGQEDRWGFFLIGFDTTSAVPAGLPTSAYRIRSVSVRATVGQDETFEYDPSYDPATSYGTPATPPAIVDADTGRPVELHGAGFRNGFTPATFAETSDYGFPDRNAYPLGFDATGSSRDVSRNVTDSFESIPWAVGTTTDAAPGNPVPIESEFHFAIDPALPGVDAYLRESLSNGKLWLTLSSLHPAIQQGGELASWITRDDAIHILFGGLAPQLILDVDLDLPLSIDATPSGMALTWPQFAGYTFHLQTSPNLSGGSWTTIHSESANDDTAGIFTDTTPLARRFYRLEILPTP